jgi:predicted DNA-binding transcriptional regulator YafY
MPCSNVTNRYTTRLLFAMSHIETSPRAKYPQTVYGRNLIQLLKAVDLMAGPNGATIKELQEGLSVSRRSIYRLFETLNTLNFPIYDNTIPGEREKRWHLEEHFAHSLPNLHLPDIRLSFRELFLLYFLLARDRVFTGTHIESDLAALREKLTSLIPAPFPTSAHADRIDSLFVAGTLHAKTYETKEEIIDTILTAISNRTVCTVSYKALSTGTTKTYAIHPLRLLEHDGGLYLFIQISKHDVTRIIAIDRIDTITPTPETFTDPPDFNPETILSTTFDLTLEDPVAVTILFSPDAAGRIRSRRWASDQGITEHPDGSLTLTMTTSGRNDVIRWLLSFGSSAEILDPQEIRQAIFKELKSAASLYS